MPAHQLNSGGNRKGLGTEDWGLATRAREPGTDGRTDRMTDIFCRPSRPPNPELGFTTLGQRTTVAVPKVLNGTVYIYI
jgi:hypothetical protein